MPSYLAGGCFTVTCEDYSPLPPAASVSTSRIDVAVLGYDPLRLVGLRAVLESEGEFAVHQVEAENLGRPLPGEIVLIGSHGLSSVFDAVAAIRTLRPEVKMILTSTSSSEEVLLRAIFAGVKGYLDEAAPAEDYMRALRVVQCGLHLASPPNPGKIRRPGHHQSAKIGRGPTKLATAKGRYWSCW